MMQRIAAALLALTLGSALAQSTLTEGEVRKVDQAHGKITLKHGEIKNVDMPPMTMAYRIRDAKMLDNVAVGDRVRFAVERVEDQYTVVALAKAP